MKNRKKNCSNRGRSNMIQKEEKKTEKQEKEKEEDKGNTKKLFSIIYGVFSSHVRSDL